MVVIDPSFWRGKRVLVTGHTGFKGSWLSLWLQKLGAEILGLSLPADTEPNLFELTKLNELIDSRLGDIRDLQTVLDTIQGFQPEFVFHLAAQALVRKSYRDPVETYASNLMGTVHVLEAIRMCDSVKVGVFVTTDKVYENLEHHYPYREEDKLGGFDPYSASKAACEIAISSYRSAFLKDKAVAVASARAGNVIGGGDWSEDRLIPDAVRAWSSGKTLEIRNPDAIRPWQHVLDPLSGYLCLAERLWSNQKIAGPYNFGPLTHEACTVRDVIERARATYGTGQVQFVHEYSGPHEAKWLSLDTSKTQHILGIKPRWSIDEAIVKTMAWYRNFGLGNNARILCLSDIDAFYQASSGDVSL